MSFLLNLLWFVLGGFWMGIGWHLAGVVMYLSIVGIPWGQACFRLGRLSFWPFGREVVDRRILTGQDDAASGTLGLLGNIVWFVVCGVWLAIGHLAAALANALTIIGIPFALQHLKLAQLAVAPIGKEVVRR